MDAHWVWLWVKGTHRFAVKADAGLNCDESIFALYSAYLSALAAGFVFSCIEQTDPQSFAVTSEEWVS